MKEHYMSLAIKYAEFLSIDQWRKRRKINWKKRLLSSARLARGIPQEKRKQIAPRFIDNLADFHPQELVNVRMTYLTWNLSDEALDRLILAFPKNNTD